MMQTVQGSELQCCNATMQSRNACVTRDYFGDWLHTSRAGSFNGINSFQHRGYPRWDSD